MSRSSEAEAYDRAKIKLEVAYLEVSHYEKQYNHYAQKVEEKRRQRLDSE